MSRIVNIEISVYDVDTYKRYGTVELKASEELFDAAKAADAIVSVVTTLLAAPAPQEAPIVPQTSEDFADLFVAAEA